MAQIDSAILLPIHKGHIIVRRLHGRGAFTSVASAFAESLGGHILLLAQPLHFCSSSQHQLFLSFSSTRSCHCVKTPLSQQGSSSHLISPYDDGYTYLEPVQLLPETMHQLHSFSVYP